MQIIPKDLNRELVGRNVKIWRMMRGFSQHHLADRAGVGITTVYKVEQGKRVRNKSLLQVIGTGLGGLVEECNSNPRLSNVKSADALFVTHRKEDTRWFVYGDVRKLVPDDNTALTQDVTERIRLGRLGLAHLFGCGLNYLMPEGPGMLLYEVHGPTDRVSQNYRDAIYHVLRGSVNITLAGETVSLAEGESIGCEGTQHVCFDLAEKLKPGQLPPLVQFIGANRVGKVPRHVPPVRGTKL
jgi:transcriptional regulator with XRE-family HTH domain